MFLQGPLCNDYGLEANATTPTPSEMTTTNHTMHCWYGMGPVADNWQEEVCAPEVRHVIRCNRVEATGPWTLTFLYLTQDMLTMV